MLCIATLAGPVAHAQLGTVYPSDRIAAGTRVNAFVTWSGSRPVEGVTVDLPEGWRLVEAMAVGEAGGAPEALRLVASSQSARRMHALSAQPLRGAQRFVLGVDVGATPGAVSVAITPVGRRADGRLVLITGWRALWEARVAEVARGRGQAFRRSGAPLVLDRRALPGLDGRAAYTVEAWLRTTDLDEVVLSTWDGQEGQPYPLEWTVDTRGRLVVYRGAPGRHVAMRTPLPVADGRWHHVAVAQDPARGWARLFLDGHAADSLRLANTDEVGNGLPLAVGGRVDDRGEPGRAYAGLLDELRVWDRARSADEIRYTMRRQLTEPIDGLVRLGFEETVPGSLLREAVRDRITAASDLSFSYPVEALHADVDGPVVRLTWETKDRENEGFAVERSLDGERFESVGRLRVRDRIAEAADGTMRFAFTDTPPESPLLYYRIRQRFADAPDRLSGALKLGLGADGEPLAVLVGNSPNPFTAATTITFELREAAPVRLSVWDVSGSRIAVLVDQSLGAGRHDIRFDAASLPSGVYFVQLQTPETRSTLKLTLTR